MKRVLTVSMSVSALIATGLSACAPKTSMTARSHLELAALESASIFKNKAPGSSTDPAEGTGAAAPEHSAPEQKKSSPMLLTFATHNMCSDDLSNAGKTNVLKANQGVVAKIYKLPEGQDPKKAPKYNPITAQYAPIGNDGSEFGTPIAIPEQDPAAIRTVMINSKSVSLDVSSLEAGNYQAVLQDKAKGVTISGLLKFTKGTDGNAAITLFYNPVTKVNDKLMVIYDENKDWQKVLPKSPKLGLANNEETPPPSNEEPACDAQASPLMIDTEGELAAASFEMSAPLDGVQFDILGTGVKKQISWPSKPARNQFLTLPNAKGLVEGADQLFGDRTRGPDGRLAANGFEALRKHDANHDGVIDTQDPVYGALRLWADLNRNGQSEPDELSPLSAKGIASINLDYINIMDADAYGNETRQRSTIKTREGTAKIIVDIWFRPVF